MDPNEGAVHIEKGRSFRDETMTTKSAAQAARRTHNETAKRRSRGKSATLAINERQVEQGATTAVAASHGSLAVATVTIAPATIAITAVATAMTTTATTTMTTTVTAVAVATVTAVAIAVAIASATPSSTRVAIDAHVTARAIPAHAETNQRAKHHR